MGTSSRRTGVLSRSHSPKLLQLRVLRLSLLQDGNVRVGVLPECQEILIGDCNGNVTSEVARRQKDGTWLWVIDRYSDLLVIGRYAVT